MPGAVGDIELQREKRQPYPYIVQGTKNTAFRVFVEMLRIPDDLAMCFMAILWVIDVLCKVAVDLLVAQGVYGHWARIVEIGPVGFGILPDPVSTRHCRDLKKIRKPESGMIGFQADESGRRPWAWEPVFRCIRKTGPLRSNNPHNQPDVLLFFILRTGNADAVYSSAVGSLYTENERRMFNHFMFLRDLTHQFQYQTGQGVTFSLYFFENTVLDAQYLAEIVQTGLPFKQPGVLIQLSVGSLICLYVKFIVDFSNDLFNDIFQCQHAGGTTILIHHNSDMYLAFLDFPEQVADIFAFRHEESGT